VRGNFFTVFDVKKFENFLFLNNKRNLISTRKDKFGAPVIIGSNE